MKKFKINYKNIKHNKIKDYALRTLSALSITFLINGFPKNIDYHIKEDENHISYSLDDFSLRCGKYDGDIELKKYINDNIDFLNIENINISGNQFITDLSYFKPFFSSNKKVNYL